jgi:hypothetical protein
MKNDKEDRDDKNDGDGRAGPSGDSREGLPEAKKPKVTGIQDWKNRRSVRRGGPARAMLYEQKIRLLTTPQKQALLIRLIVGDITSQELDALLGALLPPASGS